MLRKFTNTKKWNILLWLKYFLIIGLYIQWIWFDLIIACFLHQSCNSETSLVHSHCTWVFLSLIHAFTDRAFLGVDFFLKIVGFFFFFFFFHEDSWIYSYSLTYIFLHLSLEVDIQVLKIKLPINHILLLWSHSTGLKDFFPPDLYGFLENILLVF